VQFVLTGFTQNSGVRVFTFERIEEDRTRTEFLVTTDLALSRKYDIRMQELPLLCRKLLEKREAGEVGQTLSFSEEEMILHARSGAAEVDVRRKKYSKPLPAEEEVGTP
jgi:hypothetical protein